MLKKIPLALFLLLVTALPAHARHIADTTAGYTLDIPDDWQEVPQADFNRVIGPLFTSGPAHPVTAFEPSFHDQHFQYPFAVVATIDYPGMAP